MSTLDPLTHPSLHTQAPPEARELLVSLAGNVGTTTPAGGNAISSRPPSPPSISSTSPRPASRPTIHTDGLNSVVPLPSPVEPSVDDGKEAERAVRPDASKQTHFSAAAAGRRSRSGATDQVDVAGAHQSDSAAAEPPALSAMPPRKLQPTAVWNWSPAAGGGGRPHVDSSEGRRLHHGEEQHMASFLASSSPLSVRAAPSRSRPVSAARQGVLAKSASSAGAGVSSGTRLAMSRAGKEASGKPRPTSAIGPGILKTQAAVDGPPEDIIDMLAKAKVAQMQSRIPIFLACFSSQRRQNV